MNTLTLIICTLAIVIVLALWLILRPTRRPKRPVMRDRFNFDSYKGQEQISRGVHDRTKF